MKRIVLLVLLLGLLVVLFSCASAPLGVESISLTVNPGLNESVVIIQRAKTAVGSAIPMRVWINETDAASGIRSGNEIQLIVPNGQHTIQAGSTNIDRGNSITFDVNDEVIVFLAEPRMGVMAARFNLTQIGKRNL